ncbi:mCG1026933, partial [Mus musculus]
HFPVPCLFVTESHTRALWDPASAPILENRNGQGSGTGTLKGHVKEKTKICLSSSVTEEVPRGHNLQTGKGCCCLASPKFIVLRTMMPCAVFYRRNLWVHLKKLLAPSCASWFVP